MEDRRALVIGASAYILWGLFPIYFRLLADSGPLEVVAHRAIWSLLFCTIALLAIGRWRRFTAIARDPRIFSTLALAGFLVAINWGIYVFGVTTGRTLDASMGYFMNPLVSALLGVLVLGERLRPLQWIAFGFGAAAVVVLVLGYGEVPWIAIVLAGSFGLYGLVTKRGGNRGGALEGLTAETLALTVPAAVYLATLAASGAGTVEVFSPYGALVALSGPVTAIPLILFAYAAARLNLSTIGMLQYVAPLMLFLLGWLAYGEPMPPERWAGFALIWIAVAIFAADVARATRAPRLPGGSHRPPRGG
ncbi:MAG: EamA family transporter RarD [bacterium]|nr:EamA family transporter RarD [bacterium]